MSDHSKPIPTQTAVIRVPIPTREAAHGYAVAIGVDQFVRENYGWATTFEIEEK